MDLRVVIHRGVTIAVAAIFSLLPVAVLIAVVWPRLLTHLTPYEVFGLLAAVGVVAILVPVTRDVAERLLDRYVYRKQANYQRTVREASRILTRVLELEPLLQFVGRTLTSATEAEGLAIYLKTRHAFSSAIDPMRRTGARFEVPQRLPDIVLETLAHQHDALVADEIAHARRTGDAQRLHAELTRLSWALVLPIVSDNAVIGAIALGAKRSGDPYYPQDLDLLMTLANQAGTAVKNAQLYAAVVLANEYLGNIVATINSGVIAIDPAGEVTIFNPTAEQLTGVPAERAQSEGTVTVPEPIREALGEAIVAGTARTLPEIALSDGTTSRPVLCTTSPLRDPSGRILGAVAVFSDVTPLHELEAERRRAERAGYLEKIASGIAHEVKNPLVAIKTFVQLIERRRDDERFVHDFSRVVTREMKRMEHMVDRLRSLSRPAPRALRVLDLRQPIGDAIEFLQASFEDKRLTIDLVLDDGEAQVLGDHGELEQLVLNLLINAQEATPADGRITVRLIPSAEHAVIEVTDTGPGIPAEMLERVFDPFFTTKQRGSGLGLNICAGIAAAHRARLRASNATGGGARFSVEFPLATSLHAVTT
jgi:PAS domain S-box-containing protein